MKPSIIAKVTFLPSEKGGRHVATPYRYFSCPLLMDGEMNDCRLLLDEVGPISPGQTVDVPVAFLRPDLVRGRLVVGKKFDLWEMRIIGNGEILKVLN